LTIKDRIELLFWSGQIFACLECLRMEEIGFGRPGRVLKKDVRFGLTEMALNKRGWFCPEWNVMESVKLVLA
jgi:hypothetical protein